MARPAAIREAAIAALFAPVDGARAVWNGARLVGHRDSVAAGRMFWALPGGAVKTGETLLRHDPAFKVVNAPSSARLAEQQPVLRALLAAV